MRRDRSTFNIYTRRPYAVAVMRGSHEYPAVGGTVMFYPAGNATLVKAQIWGLPRSGAEIFGFHVHEGGSCHGPMPQPFDSHSAGFGTGESGNFNYRSVPHLDNANMERATGETFKKYAGGHFNPGGKPHPFHSGDMPPLFGCDGMAYSIFLTNRFTPDEIVGRTVIIHLNPDDFTTQPSGNSGEMIACGVIRR